MKNKLSHSARILFAAVLLLTGVLPAIPSPASAQVGSDFSINLAGFSIYGWDWPLDVPITLTVDDPATVDLQDYAYELYASPNPDPTDPHLTYVYFNLPVPLRLGYVLEMSDGVTTVAHSVPFEVTNVTIIFDQVIGKASPGEEIEISFYDYESSMNAYRSVAAGVDGVWMADFSLPGEGVNEQTVVDFTTQAVYFQSLTIQAPGNGWNVYYGSTIPAPRVNVFLGHEPDDWDIRSPMWPANTAVTLVIDDPETELSPDYTETRNTRLHPRVPYVYRVDFYLDGFQVEPGMYVTVTDGFTAVKEHLVLSLQVTEIDTANDVVCGYGKPDTETQVEVDTDDYTAIRYVMTDSDGYWCADFTEPGPNAGESDVADIAPGSEGLVLQSDSDADSSVKGFKASSSSDVDGDGTPDLEDPCPADPTNTCDADGSTAATVGTEGGILLTENQAVSMAVPADALTEELTLSITDAGSGYLLSDEGQALSVLSVDIEPSGTTFAEPVTMVFQWLDENNDGIVDGTTLPENALVIIKDGVVITGTCLAEPGCNMEQNTFTFQVSSLSTFALSAFPAPEIVSLNATAEPVNVGALVTASALIQDVEQEDVYTLIWDWGDGQLTIQADQTGNEFQATHAYAEAGVYSVRLSVDEGADGSDTAAYEYVVVYDPEGGFVTGGGWIVSPAGACRYAACTEETAGMANFGFVSKYKRGASVPTGNTEFNFKAGGLNFKSTSYQWLVVAGAKAMYKGYGTINGSGAYGFLITAIDAALSPSTDVDLFRIKIWDTHTGLVVYDNQMDAPESANPTTALGGGSIVIHK